ncbi:Acyl-CoA dehydrogenase [Salinihabitans flavidus]|uniref:Acyl-CoA dehydrogenase n=1 Tax=Salinihabitans flavidus TaxID=569882 RepID=A0A1H8UJW8_9RHOB|nr:acyl-CoA dehydrogenase family protein [Salinihabitans flavidus]SEP03471.1 Acyl-CoA dehydrogenase [Salinihabitans flavidus]
MDFELNEDEALLAEMAGKFAYTCAPGDHRWSELAEMGWFGCHLPESAGGSGLGMVGAVILGEAMGHAGLVDGYIGHAILAGSALSGSPAHTALLEAAIAGTKRLGAALIEPARRHDLTRPAAKAKRSGDSYQLDGHKAPALACSNAAYFLVSARTETDDCALFAVPADAEGVTLSPISSPDGRDLSRLMLDTVILQQGDIVAAAPQCPAYLQSALQIAFAAESCGAMRRLVDMTGAYLETREQFGRPIGRFQALQHRFADMHVALDEARSLMLAAAMATDACAPEAAPLARKAWVQTCWSARRIAEEAVQMHGAIGMTSECHVGHFVKRLTANELIVGHPDLHVGALIARSA